MPPSWATKPLLVKLISPVKGTAGRAYNEGKIGCGLPATQVRQRSFRAEPVIELLPLTARPAG
jgi:hypothetical protein